MRSSPRSSPMGRRVIGSIRLRRELIPRGVNASGIVAGSFITHFNRHDQIAQSESRDHRTG
jgi:hypothetical protein